MHVLSAPPAFVLSQDQTLQYEEFKQLSNKASNNFVQNYTLLPPIPTGPDRGRVASAGPPGGRSIVPTLHSDPDCQTSIARLALAPSLHAARPVSPDPTGSLYPDFPGEPSTLTPSTLPVKGWTTAAPAPSVKGPKDTGRCSGRQEGMGVEVSVFSFQFSVRFQSGGCVCASPKGRVRPALDTGS